MGVTKQTISPGNGTDFPNPGSMCAIDYTGALYDPSRADNHFMGKEYASLSLDNERVTCAVVNGN